MPKIDYRLNTALNTADIIRVFNNSGITRPTQDAARIAQMFANANVVVSAWDGDHLVGFTAADNAFVIKRQA